jgi:predicted  nucleic acid-binding Zn-ribbon protein
MSDLVERLRGLDSSVVNVWGIRHEAADEIERLQHQLARTEEALAAATSDAKSAWATCRASDKEIERLRALVKQMGEALEHYEELDKRNAQHYPPGFAKDALATCKEMK